MSDQGQPPHTTGMDGETTPPGRVHPPVLVTRTQIDLPVITIIKVVATIALLLLLGQIWQILFLVFLGMFLAMVLARPVSWLEGRGLPRGLAVGAVLGTAVGAVLLVLWVGAPSLVVQSREFLVHLPDDINEALAWTANRWPDFYQQATAWAETQQFDLGADSIDFRGVLSQGLDLFSGIVNAAIVVIIAVYILADRGESLEGLYHWMPPDKADKLRRTFPAVARVVNGYVVGQGINSALFAIFTFILLTALDVPSAAILALIAAIGDAIPQVGVTIATIPAVLLALTQSLETALIVLAAYMIYQVVENYVTSPRVFSQTLQLRPLVTLVAVLIGGKLLGIVGVLLALPVAAALPTVMEIWLKDDTGAA
ncbi:MAG: AI-2E family transporter [Thermomicrobiales bacterium]